MTRSLSTVFRWLATLGVLMALNAHAQGWGTPEAIENDPGNAQGADVAVAPNGNAVAVWVQADGPRTNVWARNYTTGSGLGTVQLIEAIAGGDAQYPRVAIAPNGVAHAIWLQHDGTIPSVRASRFVPGSGWSAPQYLQFVLTDAQAPRIAVDAYGSAWAVWAQRDVDSNSYSVYAAHLFTDQWGQPILLEHSPGSASLPKIAIDPNNLNALAVWDQYDGHHVGVYSSHFESLWGTWDPPVLVSQPDGGEAFDVDIAEDQFGTPIAVWRQQYGLGLNGQLSVWAAHYSGAVRVWGRPLQISAGLSPSITSAKVAMDPAGNAVAVWAESGHIWANRYAVNSNYWGGVQPIESNVGEAVAPAVTMDTSGNAIAVWMQNAGFGTNWSIYANRFVQGSGPGSGWGVAQLLESDDAGGAFNPAVAADATGNAIGVWLQSDGVRFNVLQNRFSAIATPTTSSTTTTTSTTSTSTPTSTPTTSTTTTTSAFDPEGGPAGRNP